METFTVIRNGQEFEVEAETPQEAAEKAKAAEGSAVENLPLAQRLQRGREAGASGVRTGAEGLAGMGGDIPAAIGRGAGWAAGKIGLDPEAASKSAEVVSGGPSRIILQALRMAGLIDDAQAEQLSHVTNPGSQDVASITDPAINAISPELQRATRFQPATFGERSAFETGAFLPGLAGGKGVKDVATRVVAPALATEAAGTAAQEYAPEYEPAIRMLVAAATGAGAAGLDNAGQVAQAAKDVSRNPAALAALSTALERQGMTPEQAQQALTDLGADAMLLDVGPNTLQEGQRIVAKGGPGRTTITDRLVERNEGTPQRVKDDVVDALGPAQSPTQFEAGIKAEKEALSPEYQTALQSPGTRPIDAQAIDTTLQQAITSTIGPTQAKLKEVAGYLRDGDALNSDPSRALQVRHEIDRILKKPEELSGNAIKLLNQVRGDINRALDVAAPAVRDVDTKFSKVAQKEEAFEEGGKSLQKGSKWPQDIEAEIDTRGQHVLEGYREGVRSEIENIIGNKGYNASALKQAIKSDGTFNREKLELLFGKPAADKIGKVLEREQTYQRSHARTTELSPTAERAPEAVPGGDITRDVAVATAVGGMPGMAGAVLTNTVRAGVDKLMQNRAIARDTDLADMLSSNNPSEVLRGIQLAQKKGAVLPQAVLNALLSRQHNKALQ